MADVNVAAPAAVVPYPTPSNVPAPEGVANVDVDSFDADVEGDITEVAPPTKKEIASAKKKYQLKVDGKDEEYEFDASNEEEVKKHLQLSKVSHKRMQESAEMRKGVQELLDTLRTDPLKVLSDPRLGIPDDIRKRMAESIINNELEEMAKTPEQKEKEQLTKEYERLKSEVETERKGREEAEKARYNEQQAVALDTEISDAITTSGLPKTARTVRYMAEALMFCLQNNLDLSAKDLVPYVKKQTLGEFKEMVSSLPDEEFESWLGKDQISRLRKRSIARSKAPDNPAAIKPTGVESPKSEESKTVLMKDFFKTLGR